jgi:hypothetical protein
MKHIALLSVLAIAIAAQLAAQTPGHAKTSAAILPLEAAGADPVMTLNLSGRLRHELIQTGAFDMMEREKMQEILKEQGFQQSGACNTNACIVEVGQMIGVEKMVAGNIGLVGKTYTLNVRLIDVRTSRVDRSIVEDHTGTVDRLLTEVVKRVAARLAVAARSPALPAAGMKKGGSVFTKWWFWTGVGVAAAGGTAALLLGGGSTTTEENPTDNTLPLPPNPPQAPGIILNGAQK